MGRSTYPVRSTMSIPSDEAGKRELPAGVGVILRDFEGSSREGKLAKWSSRLRLGNDREAGLLQMSLSMRCFRVVLTVVGCLRRVPDEEGYPVSPS